MIQNQLITVKNLKSGEHRTFAIKTCQKGSLAGKQLVALLIGPENESDYQAFGFIDDFGVKVWRSKDTPTFRVFAAMIEQHLGLKANGFEFKDFDWLASKRCQRCNRTLTDPLSIERGIGPECFSRI